MKSKVMSLGNKLSANMPRSEAFIKAWQIVKAGELKLTVKGVTFGIRQTALKKLTQYPCNKVVTVLVSEPFNAYDKNAIAVKVGVQYGKGLFTIGYIAKEMTGLVRALKPKAIKTEVLSGDIYGARLSLAA
ncbi:MAG: hypothetical protein FWE72_09360 [Spirochaetaceae bacterium]|nr:hypothetical protein [Spirochaetaceae bacterium]